MPVELGVAAIVLLGSSLPLFACTPVNFFELPISDKAGDPVVEAVLLAYPGTVISSDGTRISPDGTRWVDIGDTRDMSPAELLRSPTFREQFAYTYTLAFDLRPRETAYFDPGRPRNDAFFKTFYFDTESEARDSLARVVVPKLEVESFWVTTKWGVDCQLSAALGELVEQDEDLLTFFQSAGGGFNWRQISRTSRLSPHSFGIAIDINPKIGQYWEWNGGSEGNAGPFENKVPEKLVSMMERFGFIWGGKWHHFDGMHFEYRPEIILYSRIVAD